MKPRILITGGSGLLALNWALAVKDRYAVILGLHEREVILSGIETCRFELESSDTITADLERLQPQAVIHTAGLTNVEKCEVDKSLARHVNIDLAENVATACARLQLPLVHISTDHLFPGDHALVDESCPVQPQNAYGRTKAEAEVRVLEACPQSLVVRTNFYGWGPAYRQSFSDVIINALRSGKRLTLFQDVYYTPIIAMELARATHQLLERKVTGICNVVGDERISKYEFGHRLARSLGLDASLISSGLVAQQASLVQRPLDMSLSNYKVCKLLGRTLGGVSDHIALLHAQEQTKSFKELQKL